MRFQSDGQTLGRESLEDPQLNVEGNRNCIAQVMTSVAFVEVRRRWRRQKINPKSSCEKVSSWACFFADFGALGARKSLKRPCFYNVFLMLRVFQHDVEQIGF